MTLGAGAIANQRGKVGINCIRCIRSTIGHQQIDFATGVLGGDCQQIAIACCALVGRLASVQRLGAHLQRVEACAFRSVDVHQSLEVLEAAIKAIPIVKGKQVTTINVVVARTRGAD